MDLIGWISTRDWAATGGMLTAAFTGFAAFWAVLIRPRPKFRIEMEHLSSSLDNSQVTALYTIRNIGTGPAHEVRLFVTKTGLPDKQYGATFASVAAGEDVKLERKRASTASKMPLDETTRMHPAGKPDFDAMDMGIAITWTNPPFHRRTKGQREQEHVLLSDYHARHFPLG